jgi:O-antigen ligase
MYYDLELRTEYFIPIQYKIKVWLFALAICLFPMISLVVSFKTIDFSKCLKYIFVLNSIILIISLFTTINGASADERLDANMALDSISFGQIAIFATLISLYRLITEKNNSLVSKTIFIFSAFLGLFIALKTGSRGPILALFIVLIFWYSFKAKKIIVGYFKFTFLVSLMLVFMAVIFKIIGVISPITAARFNQATDGTDMSVMNRTESYIWFYHKIMESPVIGSQFARLSNGDYPGYAHNIFLDVLLCFGVSGLSVFLYIIYNALRSTRLCIISNENYWVGLILIEFFILSLTSGAYYSSPELNCAIVLILLMSKNQYKELVN